MLKKIKVFSEEKKTATGFIYIFYHITNNKVYVGQSITTPEKVISRYKKEIKYKRQNRLIIRAMRKHGFEAFKFLVVDKDIPVEHLDEMESVWIEFYDSHKGKLGYNATEGGEGTVGYKWSEESKRQQSIRASQRTGEKNPFYGKKHTQDVKDKIAESNRRRKGLKRDSLSIETRNRISEAMTGNRVGALNNKSKIYRVISPQGEVYEFIGGFVPFCRKHGIKSPDLLKAVANNKREHYKEWRCEFIEK